MADSLCTVPYCHAPAGHGPLGNRCREHWEALSPEGRAVLEGIAGKLKADRKPRRKAGEGAKEADRG